MTWLPLALSLDTIEAFGVGSPHFMYLLMNSMTLICFTIQFIYFNGYSVEVVFKVSDCRFGVSPVNYPDPEGNFQKVIVQLL